MAGLMRGTDITLTLRNLPVGCEIKRLDFGQNKEIVFTKYPDDFTIEGTVGYVEITQEEALKISDKYIVEMQLSYYLGGKARRTRIAKIPAEKILYEGEI